MRADEETTLMVRSYPIRTENDCIVALSKLRAVALEFGLNNYDATRLVTAASELVRNILKYAGTGDVSYSRLVDGAKLGVEVIAHDNGPGIADVELAMAENYSSSGTLGLGLPGVRRLVDDCDMKSEVDAGTTLAFKVWKT